MRRTGADFLIDAGGTYTNVFALKIMRQMAPFCCQIQILGATNFYLTKNIEKYACIMLWRAKMAPRPKKLVEQARNGRENLFISRRGRDDKFALAEAVTGDYSCQYVLYSFSCMPLNFDKSVLNGTCGIIFCKNSSRYKGAGGRSNLTMSVISE
uniref:Uncharacterized protein n=1 Tax=Romanomermis culicivorax TaxID=13658 RepID=A0A915HVQ7_ROMCU